MVNDSEPSCLRKAFHELLQYVIEYPHCKPQCHFLYASFFAQLIECALFLSAYILLSLRSFCSEVDISTFFLQIEICFLPVIIYSGNFTVHHTIKLSAINMQNCIDCTNRKGLITFAVFFIQKKNQLYFFCNCRAPPTNLIHQKIQIGGNGYAL